MPLLTELKNDCATACYKDAAPMGLVVLTGRPTTHAAGVFLPLLGSFPDPGKIPKSSMSPRGPPA